MGDISIKGRSPILRQGFAVGGTVKLAKALAKKFKKKKVYPETENLTHQKGPYIGDVGSEGKKRKGRRPQDTEDEPKGFKKGGGVDTGKLGELKSKLGVGQIKLDKAQKNLKKIKRLKKKLGIKND